MAASPDIHIQEERFKELFHRYKKPIHDYVQTITGSQEVAEEITQEVFIRLWKKRQSYNEIQNIDYYIFRIAKNQCMNYFKEVAVNGKLMRGLRDRMTIGEDAVSEKMDYQETRDLLNKAVASLSPQRRKVYQLSRIEALSIEEIAEVMQISYNTAKNHLVEALRQIREFYVKNHPDFLLLLFWVFALIADRSK